MFKVMHYQAERPEVLFLIVAPHSSDGRDFLEEYPQILAHQEVREHLDLFRTYLKIESDYGSKELACALAEQFKEQGYSSIVCELDYPRGLLDGGRVLEHCLRDALPSSLNELLHEDWLRLHQDSLKKLDDLYKIINENQGLLLDIHTMASYSPMQGDAITTHRESFEKLKTYVKQFVEAPKTPDNLRLIDLISADDAGNEIGDQNLKKCLIEEFEEGEIPFVENDPYVAEPAFLMNRHLVSTSGVAIDVPKHMVAKVAKPEDLQLDRFDLDPVKIEGLSRVIAKASLHALKKKGPL